VIGLLLLLLNAASLTPVDEASFPKLVAAHKGKVVVVNFWATWCAPCRAEMPQLLAFERQYERKGIELVLVSADEPSEARQVTEFLTSQKAARPWYIKKTTNDDRFIDSIDSKWSGALPATFVYDRAGRRVKSFFGEIEIKELEKAISGL
jgi:thiol-disulfide isomerase/thioredoxin